MAQKRPYRASSSPMEILALLRQFEAKGEIDGYLVDLVANNLEGFHAIALGLLN
jgi:HD-GYP domain-containing protein (c-di-GMP phosphodiesterase class II)